MESKLQAPIRALVKVAGQAREIASLIVCVDCLIATRGCLLVKPYSSEREETDRRPRMQALEGPAKTTFPLIRTYPLIR